MNDNKGSKTAATVISFADDSGGRRTPTKEECFMSVNRKRNKQILMRLTNEEHDLLLQRMVDAGMQNQEAFLRQMTLTGHILRLDLSEVREELRLLSNIASNINQVVKMANQTRSIYATDMIKLRDEVSNLRTQVSNVMKVFSKVRELLAILK